MQQPPWCSRSLLILLALACMGQGAGGADHPSSAFGSNFYLNVLVVALLSLVLVGYAIVDVTRRVFPDGTTKIVWALVILFVPILGPLLYPCVGKRQGERKSA